MFQDETFIMTFTFIPLKTIKSVHQFMCVAIVTIIRFEIKLGLPLILVTLLGTMRLFILPQ